MSFFKNLPTDLALRVLREESHKIYGVQPAMKDIIKDIKTFTNVRIDIIECMYDLGMPDDEHFHKDDLFYYNWYDMYPEIILGIDIYREESISKWDGSKWYSNVCSVRKKEPIIRETFPYTIYPVDEDVVIEAFSRIRGHDIFENSFFSKYSLSREHLASVLWDGTTGTKGWGYNRAIDYAGYHMLPMAYLTAMIYEALYCDEKHFSELDKEDLIEFSERNICENWKDENDRQEARLERWFKCDV